VSKVYGVDRDEMVRLRAQGAELLARREDHGVIQDKVMRFFARNGRSTARRVAGALNLRLAKSVASGQRYAAAYKPTGDEG
jgi:hypothetical protein